MSFFEKFLGNKKEEQPAAGPRVESKVMRAVKEAEQSMSKLPEKEEVETWGDEDIKDFLKSIIDEIEAEDSSATEILDSKPVEVVNRRVALEKGFLESVKVRIKGVEKGQATMREVRDGLKKMMKKQIDKYKEEDVKRAGYLAA